MKPLLTMSEEAYALNLPHIEREPLSEREKHVRRVLVYRREIDAQRAVPSPEPVEAQIQALKAEIAVGDTNYENLRKVIDAIPECPAHGGGCIPHALEWIAKVKVDAAAVRRQAIEDCIAYACREADAIDSRVEMAPAHVKELATFGAASLREFAKSLEGLREGESGKDVK